jgi:NADPH2:quinone reductase
MRQLLSWLSEGKLQPLVSKVYALDRAAEALRAIMDRQATGKLVLVP